jgi:hypothetical protein
MNKLTTSRLIKFGLLFTFIATISVGFASEHTHDQSLAMLMAGGLCLFLLAVILLFKFVLRLRKKRINGLK